MRHAQRRLYALLAFGSFSGLAIWAADDLKTWLQPAVDRAFQTSGIRRGEVDCILPTEREQLVVVFAWTDGRIRHRCMYVGSRGTYSPRAKGTNL